MSGWLFSRFRKDDPSPEEAGRFFSYPDTGDHDPDGPGRFFMWTATDDPGLVLPATENGWNALRRFYAPQGLNEPLERIIQIAEDHGVQSVVVELRYIDIDFRSEHSHFYSTTFRRYPSVCHRLHFFAAHVKADLSNLSELEDDPDVYKGYSIMRPLPSSPVGRTMIAPPEDLLEDAILCSATDVVHLWGRRFKITAMPFVSQDAQYLRCAHACLWMTLYHGSLAHDLPRRLPHDIHEAATGGQVFGRQLPSDGLSPAQVLQALYQMNMAGGHIELPETREKSRELDPDSLYGILCRYVNSNMPPIVYSPVHAWIVVGYLKEGEGPSHDLITLYRHDDRKGPYLKVDSPFAKEGEEDDYLPWRSVIPPLPQKVYMTGERAETVGEYRIFEAVYSWKVKGHDVLGVKEDNLVRQAIEEGRLSLRTYAMRSYVFKEGNSDRGVPPLIADAYQLAHCPRWIWVVEAIDRKLSDARHPAVIGEVIIDATASDVGDVADPVAIAVHVGGEARIFSPDHESRHPFRVDEMKPYRSAAGLDRGVESDE